MVLPVASFAARLRCGGLSVLLGLVGGCAASAVTLSSGVVHVSFTTDETCGFSNPYTVDARGCRRLDEKAVMCKGFGVIDGVLFAGGCEAPADLDVLETQGTMPLSPPRSAATTDEAEASPATRDEAEASELPDASAEPEPKVEKRTRSASKSSSVKSASSKKAKTKKASASKRKKRAE
ncbi:MAG: hypothetical protein RL033_4830 [Pseudomonadota bacterium]|jgi:hypothetical protein